MCLRASAIPNIFALTLFWLTAKMVSGYINRASASNPSMGMNYSPSHARKSSGRLESSIVFQLYQRNQPRPLLLDSSTLDYSKQLRVETSVEYDLPSHIYPPKDAEPILKIDDDYQKRKKKNKANKPNVSNSLHFLVGGPPSGIGTVGTSSNKSLAQNSSTYGTSDRSRTRAVLYSYQCCGAAHPSSSTPSKNPSSSSSSSYPSSSTQGYTSSFTTRSSRTSVVPVITMASPSLLPAHQAKPVPVYRSSKKSKAAPPSTADSNIQEIQQRYQHFQQQLYPLPPPSYATAIGQSGSSLYPTFADRRNECSTVCQNSLCTTCSAPMVGAGPPDLVPHAIATAHIVRSRGSPKVRTRRHLAATSANHVPEYLRRPRSNTIGHTSLTAAQHSTIGHTSLAATQQQQHNSIGHTSLAATQHNTIGHTNLAATQHNSLGHTNHASAQHSSIGHTSLAATQQSQLLTIQPVHYIAASESKSHLPSSSKPQLPHDTVTSASVVQLGCPESEPFRCLSESSTSTTTLTPHRTSKASLKPSYNLDVYTADARIADTAQMYSAPITPAELMDGDFYPGAGRPELDTTPTMLLPGATRPSVSTSADDTSSLPAIVSSVFGGSSSTPDHRYFLQQDEETATATSTATVRPHRKNKVSSRIPTSTESTSSLAQKQQQQQQHFQLQQQQLQRASQMHRSDSKGSLTAKTSGQSNMPSTPSRHLGSLNAVVAMDTGSPFSSSNTHYAKTLREMRDFTNIFDGSFSSSSSSPLANTSLFGSRPLSHTASALLGVPTPPQSTNMSTPTTPGSNAFFASMYHLNSLTNTPIYNLAYWRTRDELVKPRRVSFLPNLTGFYKSCTRTFQCPLPCSRKYKVVMNRISWTVKTRLMKFIHKIYNFFAVLIGLSDGKNYH